MREGPVIQCAQCGGYRCMGLSIGAAFLFPRRRFRRGAGKRRARSGLPTTIRVALGTEFVSRDLDRWAYQRGVTLDFSRPAKPTENAFIESFNGKFRAECLNAHWFM